MNLHAFFSYVNDNNNEDLAQVYYFDSLQCQREIQQDRIVKRNVQFKVSLRAISPCATDVD